ncbi:YcxB family protein [Actinoplanes sp. G11-F43]|uniref:YcxB family protein n=1 Tax=Actinoplanes sp. G11-F43 TaxID=3424130 RepID=UPI003D330CFC
MVITGRFQHTYQSFRRLSLASLGKSRFGMWAGGALLTLVVVTTDLGRDQPWMYGFAPFMIAVPELVAYLSWRQQKKLITVPVEYEITETALHVRAAQSESRLDWAGLTWVKRTKHGWLLKTGAMQAILPRDAFTPADQATIDAFLAAAPVQVKS